MLRSAGLAITRAYIWHYCTYVIRVHWMPWTRRPCYDSWDTRRLARLPRTSSTDKDVGHDPYGHTTEALQREHVLGPFSQGVTMTWNGSAHDPH
jgi:hypothetical protein